VLTGSDLSLFCRLPLAGFAADRPIRYTASTLLRALTLFLAIYCGACRGSDLDLPAATEPARLVDCSREFMIRTEEHLASRPESDFQGFYRLANLSPEVRVQVLEASTQWAVQHEYLPCSYQMCAALLNDENDAVLSLIRPVEDRAGWLAPAADLVVSTSDISILRANPSHTGCALRKKVFESS
jgi:hypothetical protein